MLHPLREKDAVACLQPTGLIRYPVDGDIGRPARQLAGPGRIRPACAPARLQRGFQTLVVGEVVAPRQAPESTVADIDVVELVHRADVEAFGHAVSPPPSSGAPLASQGSLKWMLS